MAAMGVSVAAYEPTSDSELQLAAGDVLEVLDSRSDDWWLVARDPNNQAAIQPSMDAGVVGTTDRREGWVPASYVRLRDAGDAAAAGAGVVVEAGPTTDPQVLRDYLEMLQDCEGLSAEDLAAVCEDEGVRGVGTGDTVHELVRALRAHLLRELARVDEATTSSDGQAEEAGRRSSRAPARQTAVGSPVATAPGNTRQQYQELISTMNEEDLREICGEEGITVPPQLTAAAVREILWAHFDAKLSALDGDLATTRMSNSGLSALSPRGAAAQFEQGLLVSPGNSRDSSPPHLVVASPCDASEQPTASQAEYTELIQSIQQYADAAEMCEEVGIVVPPDAELGLLQELLLAYYVGSESTAVVVDDVTIARDSVSPAHISAIDGSADGAASPAALAGTLAAVSSGWRPQQLPNAASQQTARPSSLCRDLSEARDVPSPAPATTSTYTSKQPPPLPSTVDGIDAVTNPHKTRSSPRINAGEGSSSLPVAASAPAVAASTGGGLSGIACTIQAPQEPASQLEHTPSPGSQTFDNTSRQTFLATKSARVDSTSLLEGGPPLRKRPRWNPIIDDPAVMSNAAAKSVREWFTSAAKQDTATETNAGQLKTEQSVRGDGDQIVNTDFCRDAESTAPQQPYDGEVKCLRLRKIPGLGFGLKFKEHLEHPMVVDYSRLSNGAHPPAIAAGVKLGSFLLSVDGALVNSMGDVIAALQKNGTNEADFGFFRPKYIADSMDDPFFKEFGTSIAAYSVPVLSLMTYTQSQQEGRDQTGGGSPGGGDMMSLMGDPQLRQGMGKAMGNKEVREATTRVAKAQAAGQPVDPKDLILLATNQDAQGAMKAAATNDAVSDAGMRALTGQQAQTNAPGDSAGTSESAGRATGIISMVTSLAGPLWYHPSFVDALADSFASKPARMRACPPGPANLYASCDLVAQALRQIASTSRCPGLRQTAQAFSQSLSYISDLPTFSKDGDKLCQYLQRVNMLVSEMDFGQSIILPTGWARPAGPPNQFDATAMVLVVHRRPTGLFSLAVCNTGEGSDYHPVGADGATGELRHSCSLALYDIPPELVRNTAVWFLIFRMLVYPSKRNGPAELYEKILPMLNKRPLLTNKIGALPGQWQRAPVSGDISHFQAVLEAVRHTLVWSGFLPSQANCITIFVRWTILQWLQQAVGGQPVSDASANLIKAACKQMAEIAAEEGRNSTSPITSSQLQAIAQAVDTTQKKVDDLGQTHDPPLVDVPALQQISAQHGIHRMFGRLRCDVSADAMEGDSSQSTIELPVELTRVGDSVNNNREAAAAMRTCVKLCTRLDNQRDIVKNSYLHRAAIIQHLFTRVIPLPLPFNHPEATTRCFWSAQPLRYADQADIMRSLNMLCRHYTAVSLSLSPTQSFDAVRMLVLGCIACLADAVMRITACDNPSHLTLHYSGKAAGPIHPFGFEMGHYAEESETAVLTCPELTVARTQLLDYWRGQTEFLDDGHIVFRFEQSMQFGTGDHNLLRQLCLSTGFPVGKNDPKTGLPDDTLVRYLSYDDRELIDSFPELAFFRDIVYCCKAVMAPTSDALPEINLWRPKDAALTWEHKGEGELVVVGFGRQLKCQAFVDPTADTRNLFQKLYKRKPRKPLSGGDPSNLADEEIECEGDVLHLKNLPNFDGKLSSRFSELLLQYLTVPYLRIPLVMQFFSDQVRVKTLVSDELQVVLDACLFEPGLWQAQSTKSMPRTVPVNSRSHLATPCGLLFNELTHAPQLIQVAVQEMMALVVELDEGKFSWRSSPFILYIVRLLVRLEGYMLFLVEHDEWRLADVYSGCGAKSFVRGLRSSSEALSIVSSTQRVIRERLMRDFYPLVHRWLSKCASERKTRESAVLHVHLAYMYKNFEERELNHRAVTSILTAQMFLHNSYTFDMSEGKSKGSRVDHGRGSGLGFDQVEVFDLFQKHRNKCLAWLLSNQQACSEVMEEIERVLTMLDQSRAHASDDESNSPASMLPRQWISLSETGYVGRFQPDTEVRERAKRPSPDFDSYEDWLRYTTTQEVETEINVQMGTFTMKKQQMQVLPTEIASDPDFRHVFRNLATDLSVQCACVRKTTNRLWLRLLGRRHDVHWWAPDDRKPVSAHRRKYPSKLQPTEDWIRQKLQPVLAPYVHSMRVCVQLEDASNANMAQLSGYLLLDTDPNDGTPINQDEPLHEFIVFRDPEVVYMYNVVQHGRRWHRELVFCTDSAKCLHDMPLTPYILRERAVFEAGSIENALHAQHRHTLRITRNVSSVFGVQLYIPNRFLHGLLPDALLHQYEFWQQDDCDDLIGYPLAETREAAITATVLKVSLLKSGQPDLSGFGNSAASAIIRRLAILPSSSPYDFEVDPSLPVLSLIDLLNPGATSPLVTSFLRDLLLRVDDYSNILVWTEDDVVGGSGMPVSVSLVEFPRLNIAFRVKEKNGEMRLCSENHAGLFISNARNDQLRQLLDGLPTSLLLESASRDLFVIIPAGTKPSLEQQCILIERCNAKWLGNLGDVRHYLYPIHMSGTFLCPSSLAASFYMLLWRLFTGAYAKAFKIVESCVSDTKLSGEERQIWQQIGEVDADVQPNACACRLKMSLLTMGCEDSMRCVWNPRDELAMYCGVRQHVSAACRLSHTEELDLIDQHGAFTLELVNRRSFLQSFAEAAANGTCALAQVQYPVVPQGSLPFDRLSDLSCIEEGARAPTLDKTTALAYRRPLQKATSKEPEETLLGGATADFLHDRLDGGLRMTGTLGFLFFYELFTGSLNIRLLPTDETRDIASALLRMLPASDAESGVIMSILRVLDANPHLREKEMVPEYTEESGIFAKGRGKGKFLDTVIRSLQQNAGDINEAQVFLCPQDHWLMYGNDEHPRMTLGLSPPTVQLCTAEELPSKDRTAVWPRVTEFGRSHRILQQIKCTAESGTAVGITAAEVMAHAGEVMEPIGLHQYVVHLSRTDRGLEIVKGDLPFDVTNHEFSKSHVALQMNARLMKDTGFFAQKANASQVARMVHMLDDDVKHIIARSGEHALRALTNIHKLLQALQELKQHDRNYVSAALMHCVRMANSQLSISMSDEAILRKQQAFLLGQASGREAHIDFELLVGLLQSSNGEQHLRSLNPSLSAECAKAIMDLVISIMLGVSRLGQTLRCESMAHDIQHILSGLPAGGLPDGDEAAVLFQSLVLKSSTLAQLLTCRRHCVHSDDDGVSFYYDPRFLGFEFSYGYILRKQQYHLVKKFMQAASSGASLCHQMIMGAGKTTVVAPMLALIFADGERSVTQVVPGALLEMSRSVMRSAFAAVIIKSVYTFNFDRRARATPELYNKLLRARQKRAIVCSSPTAVKSFVLKLVEMLHILDYEAIVDNEELTTGGAMGALGIKNPLKSILGAVGLGSVQKQREWTPEELEDMRAQCEFAGYIMEIFRTGILLLDEVDMILHPLKSELNWPLGEKKPLDLTKNRSEPGLRWQVPFVLLDAILYYAEKRITIEFGDRKALALLRQLTTVISQGCGQKSTQIVPHFVLLDREFYNQQMKPLLARWIVLWLTQKRFKALSAKEMYEYLTQDAKSKVADVINEQCSDEEFKLLNISRDWLSALLPFILSKINRVSFGLLSTGDVERAKKTHPRMPRSRTLLAVPFIGKDVPTEASEFSHPDIIIGLTIRAYRYEGMRCNDFVSLLSNVQEDLQSESGPYNKRPSYHKYNKWVALAGGRVRGVTERSQIEYLGGYAGS
jgi:hypothetical protein